ncbi:hypothetical protein N8131_02255 [Flavobacteriaceae bacterium]|nr:hypothetical protein [Flavobacteriaceae bacterium]
MKKGLLSILASALLVVGCQNYDDQFSNLESQISALATTVAGLAQVQSDLSSLAGTVASLSSTVNGLGSTIDTAVANGLADIQADVDAITTAVADVASSEEVDALSTAVAAAGADLDELLANSSVFSGNVTINSVATLAAFKAMGSTLAIINGNVAITAKTDMNQADIQAVVDEMLTITGDFSYTSQAAEIAETKFTNLSGVQSITVDQAGGYNFPALVSASDITLGTTFSSKVGIIDFGELTSVVKFSSTADHQVHFSKATNFHITKLTRYGASLSVLLDEGSQFLMDALTDTNAAGTQSPLALTIEGPKAMNISKLDGKGGSVSFKDVVTVTVTDYDGAITLLAGVETFSSNNVVAITHGGADDIVSFTAKGVLDPNATAAAPDTSGPAIGFSSKSDLETIVLTGDFESITLNGNNNLVSATIGATSSNGIIDITDNGDLTTLDTTGSKATGFTLTNNDNLISAALQTIMIAGTGKTDVVDGAVIVTNNDDMTTLEIWSSGLQTLTITGNTDLNKITGEKIIAVSATTPVAATASTLRSVSIFGNDLEATTAQVLTPKTAAAVSTGAFTSAANMGSLAAFLKLIAADTTATAAVYFDTVQSTTDSATLETIVTTTGSVTANSILVTTPGTADVTTGNNDLILEQRAWAIPNASGIQLNLTVDTVEVLHNGSGYGLVTTTGNMAIDLTAIKSALGQSRAITLGTKLDVRAEGNPLMPSVTFLTAVTSATNGENYTNTEVAAIGAGSNKTMLTSYDVFTLTVDGKSASASITLASGATSATGQAAADAIVRALDAAWTPYGTGASATQSLWDTTSATAKITVALKASTSGSRGFGKSVAIAWTAATAAQVSLATAGVATSTIMDWIIGDTQASSDNSSTGSALIMTLTEVTNRITAGSQATVTFVAAGSAIELATTNYTKTNGSGAYLITGVATTTATDIHETDARGDVVNREAANEGTTASGTPRFITNRSGWTFSG